MNNKTAEMIRDYGMSRVFDGMEFSELIRIDSGKFIFPVDVEGTVYFCEVDFIAKKDDYTPDYDVSKYAEKVARMEKAQQELKERKAKKNVKKAE
jgi:hypothetical protein